ncbi:MAG TPA: class I SAM-dependent methyltransferase [Devosiaceae bacterium]
MSFDYDKLYGETRDALGPPTQVFLDFFERFDGQNARVLDVGCGQGRDALFIARRGHRVVGMDISPNGIRDLAAAAKRENLAIEAVVADLTTYTPEGAFDIVLADRTLHMLPRTDRLTVLARLLDHVAANGWLLIADEPRNIKDFEAVIAAHGAQWANRPGKRGYLFAQRS